MNTDITAWLGAITGVLGLMLGVINIWYNNRKLDVELPGMKTVDTTFSTQGNPREMLSFRLSNPRSMPIHVRDLWLVLPNGKELPIYQYLDIQTNRLDFRFTVEPFKGWDFIVAGDLLLEDLESNGITDQIKVHIKVYDETGRSYKSKVFPLSIPQLAKSRGEETTSYSDDNPDLRLTA